MSTKPGEFQTKRGYPGEQRASVTAIRPNQAQPHERVRQDSKNQFGAVAILNIGGVNDHAKHETERVDDQMTLASADFLARIVTADAPLDVVFTDWLSMIAAEGIRLRPSLCRTSPRS
jgi:hypothetical protein